MPLPDELPNIVLYFVIDYFLSIVLANFSLDLLELPCYLGVFQALNLLISIAITGYVANQLVSYFRGIYPFYAKPYINANELEKSEIIVHYVVKGDTLYNISKRYNAGINDIIVLNNIQNNNIMLGQNLKIRTNTNGNSTTYNANQSTHQTIKPIVNQHQYNNINPYNQDSNGKNYDDSYVGTKESYSSNNKVNNYLLKTNNKSSNPTFLSRYAPKF